MESFSNKQGSETLVKSVFLLMRARRRCLLFAPPLQSTVKDTSFFKVSRFTVPKVSLSTAGIQVELPRL